MYTYKIINEKTRNRKKFYNQEDSQDSQNI